MRRKIITLTILQFIHLSLFVYADEVYLKNKDRISGKIVEENAENIVIETEAMGSVSVKKGFVEKVFLDEEVKDAKEKEERSLILWERELSIGYNKSGGNTQDSQFSFRLFIHRKTDYNEFHLRGESFYASSNREMNAQQWRGIIRYGYSFWERKWYNFYKLEGDHDRFANINYRMVPSTGVGYWFSDRDEWKAMVEMGLGLEHTNYSDNTNSDSDVVIIPRIFFEKRIFKQSKFSQDILFYPSMENRGEIRMHGETVLTTPLSGKLSLRLSFIEDYDSHPVEGVKKRDFKFLSSLNYAF
jgi:putative salt-induced outer membrane protein YdiY